MPNVIKLNENDNSNNTKTVKEISNKYGVGFRRNVSDKFKWLDLIYYKP